MDPLPPVLDNDKDHEAMLTNTGCGSSLMSGGRWSLWAFDLGFAPDTFDGSTIIASDDDAVFGLLLDSLFEDMDRTVNELACVAVDGQSVSPLDTLDCGAFNGAVTNTRDKFGKCLDAALINQVYTTTYAHTG